MAVREARRRPITDQAEFPFKRAPASAVAAATGSTQLARAVEVEGAINLVIGALIDGLALKQDLDLELIALASTTSAANKLPYYTGSGTAATADLTSFARTMLDDADADAVRTTINAAKFGHFRTVRAASTANGTLASAFENGDTMDGVTLATGDDILLKNQTTQSENGLWRVNASGSPTRLSDADSDVELRSVLVLVREGTANKRTLWLNTNSTAITVGSTSVTFASYVSTLGLGTLAFQSDLDLTQITDSGGAGPDGAIVFWKGGVLLTSSEPPAPGWAPFWDGSAFDWFEVSP